MIRTPSLTILAVCIASSPSFGQMGGVRGGMAKGTTAQRGGLVGPGFVEVPRSVEVELEGGQRVSGTMDLRPITVDTDLGQYYIMPDKIKMIRFLKPANDVAEVGDANGGDGGGGIDPRLVAGAAPRNAGGALRQVRMGQNGPMGTALTRGKLVTTTDKEIIGNIYLPADFRIIFDFGSLNPSPDKLRSITFTSEHRRDKPATAGAASVPTGPASAESPSPPRYFREGSSVIVTSPPGDRVTLINLETKKPQTLALSGSKEAPLEVIPIATEQFIALQLRGSKITRIAVADTASGTWHAQELRTPVDGRAVPIVAAGVAVYILGRDVYAYSALARRWDVAELAEGVQATPMVGPGTATIENHGHIYVFVGSAGKWQHVDVRAVLETVESEKGQAKE